jgi:hypothetical protein
MCRFLVTGEDGMGMFWSMSVDAILDVDDRDLSVGSVDEPDEVMDSDVHALLSSIAAKMRLLLHIKH